MADKHQSKSIMDSSCKIHVTNLKKNFGKLEVLKDISLDVAEGEVVVLLGPSGSGKSTLLRCLNQLETATSGQIIIDGHDVTDRHTDINKVRENIGMVFQHFNLFNHLTVMDNMTLAPVHLKLATKEERAGGRSSSFRGWGWRIRRRRIPASSQADRSSVWPSPAPLP